MDIEMDIEKARLRTKKGLEELPPHLVRFLGRVRDRVVRLDRRDRVLLDESRVYTWLRAELTRGGRYRRVLLIFPDEVVIGKEDEEYVLRFIAGRRQGQSYRLEEMGVYDGDVVNNILLEETRRQFSEVREYHENAADL